MGGTSIVAGGLSIMQESKTLPYFTAHYREIYKVRMAAKISNLHA